MMSRGSLSPRSRHYKGRPLPLLLIASGPAFIPSFVIARGSCFLIRHCERTCVHSYVCHCEARFVSHGNLSFAFPQIPEIATSGQKPSLLAMTDGVPGCRHCEARSVSRGNLSFAFLNSHTITNHHTNLSTQDLYHL